MSEIADRFVVILDANVLFPVRIRDALLRFTEAGLYRARWTPEIIQEWRNNLIKLKPHLEASIDRQIELMAEHFPEAEVCGYEDLIRDLDLPDPKDHHVLAAAIKCGAQNIVTENIKDFPKSKLDKYGIQAVRADEYLTSVFELYPADAIRALRTMRLAYDNPPFNPSEFLHELMRCGLGQTAYSARKFIEFL